MYNTMHNELTMQEFVNKYAKHDVVTYQPTDLTWGDTILVFSEKWYSAIFLKYGDIDKDLVVAIKHGGNTSGVYSVYAVIEG